MIYLNFVELYSLMLQAKFQNQRPSGSEEELKVMIYINYDGPECPMLHAKIFYVFFTIYGHGGHLGHVTRIIYINFRSPFLRMLHMKFGFDWPSGFRGEDL